MTTSQTLAACLAWGAGHENGTIRTEASRLNCLCNWRELTRADLAEMPASVPLYLERIAPRFDPNDADLLRDIGGRYGIGIYQQYQRAGRRLIDRFTGEHAAAAERAARSDAWSQLLQLLRDLASAGLVRTRSLPAVEHLADVCRRIELTPRELGVDQIPALRGAIRHTSEWGKIETAVRFLDRNRLHPSLLALLPSSPIGPIDEAWRRDFVLPQAISDMVDAWATRASKEKVADARFEAHADPLSASTSSRRHAVLRNYVFTAAETGAVSLATVADLAELFAPSVVEATLRQWVETSSTPGGLSFGSISDYSSELLVILSRNGRADLGGYLEGLSRSQRRIAEGRAQRKVMSPKNQAWCRTLLANEATIDLFETQHVRYWHVATEVLAEAADKGLDLKGLVTTNALARLPARKRSLANALIERARRFGVSAAFAAIELEGAPFRKRNVLDLTPEGPSATFFDHSATADPHFTIILPNELLKNGKDLTRRGEQLPPIEIRDMGPADHGFTILRWYIDEIRPLFAGAGRSSHLFPSCERYARRLSTGAFDTWLFKCSTEIGLPLKPHNFRHGYVSIQYAADRSCLGDLAIIMGDLESTLRRHYRFIDRARTARQIQDDVRRRRAERRSAWSPVALQVAA